MKPASEAVVNSEIDRLVRQARLSAGVTQVAMAMRLGVSQQQVMKYETCVNRLSVRALLEIARFLGADVANLFPPFEGASEETIDIELAVALGRLDPSVRRRIDNLVDVIVESGSELQSCAKTRS